VASSEWGIELPDGGAQTAALSLRVAAVVFEDGSFAGDPEVSRAILAARSARLEEMKQALAFLRGTRSSGQRGVVTKESLAARASELRRESRDSKLSDGLRREVAAQLSAAKLEVAELFESLGATIAVEVMVGGDGLIGSAISGLEAQIAVGEGRGSRDSSPEGGATTDRARKGVQ
jgi:hypothetical protein